MQVLLDKMASPLLLLLLLLTVIPAAAAAPPLSTQGPWITDSSGQRVKLSCVNWVSHLPPMLAEGLHRRPLSAIASTISSWGFNCVRLTYATSMFTNSTLATRPVSSTFSSLRLRRTLRRIASHNPHLVHLSTTQAFSAVVSELGLHGVFVILDNQMSVPGWCCADDDGNGFWGDRDFDPSDWVAGLSAVATAFRNSSHVVGMSLRNELRGPRQNVDDWYRYMEMGANAVHQANPDILVIFGGLSYAQNLRFLANRSLSLGAGDGLANKAVYELHRYSFTNGNKYTNTNVNDECSKVSAEIESAAGFLRQPGRSYTGPLFVSEFGVDSRGISANDDLFLPCFFSILAAGDLDWAVWALQGSYYLRDNVTDLDEVFGLFNHRWDAPRNVSLLRRLQGLQQPFTTTTTENTTAAPGGGDVNAARFLLFHASTALCVHANVSATRRLFLQDCKPSASTSDAILPTWSLLPSSSSAGGGSYIALATQPPTVPEEGSEPEQGGLVWTITAQGDGQDVVLGNTSTAEVVGSSRADGIEDPGTVWLHNATDGDRQFAAEVGGVVLCLDGSSAPGIVTRPCVCRQGAGPSGGNSGGCVEDPTAQWFRLLPLDAASAAVGLAGGGD